MYVWQTTTFKMKKLFGQLYAYQVNYKYYIIFYNKIITITNKNANIQHNIQT